MPRIEPHLIPAVSDLARGLRDLEVPFAVVGALVPDLLLDVKPRRMTSDVDATVIVQSAADFEALKGRAVSLVSFWGRPVIKSSLHDPCRGSRAGRQKAGLSESRPALMAGGPTGRTWPRGSSSELEPSSPAVAPVLQSDGACCPARAG